MGSDSKLDAMLTDRPGDLNIFEAERHSKQTDALASEESIFGKSTATPVGLTRLAVPPSARHVDLRLSKEATKLASLVPQIHNVRDGKLFPNDQRLICTRCSDEIAAKSVEVDVRTNAAYTKRTADYDKAAMPSSRQPSLSKKITPRRMSRLANSVEFGEKLSKTGYSQDTSTRSGLGSKLRVQPTNQRPSNVFNFNTINVVGTPAHLNQALSPVHRMTPSIHDPKNATFYGFPQQLQ